VAAKLVFDGYATFTTPLGTVVVVMPRIPKLYAWVVANGGELLSVTLAVKLKGPATLGIPPRAPPELSVIPAGNAPELIVQL
jgi:hypothetical protein